MIYQGQISGKWVTLKSASLDDLEFTYDIRQDKERTKYMHRVDSGLDAQKEWLEWQMAEPQDYFFVVRNKAGEPIGTYSIYNMRENKREAEIGRAILNGNAIENYETILLIRDFAFHELCLDKLISIILCNNKKSIGIVVKSGGIECRRVYDEHLNTDLIYYETTIEEYEKRRPKLMEVLNNIK